MHTLLSVPPTVETVGETAAVNGVALHLLGEQPPQDELRQRAYTELLRQAAIEAGLLSADDPAPHDGIPTEAASAAIERLLDQSIQVPEPSEEACRRHYAAQQAVYRRGERVQARHILFAVTPGVDVQQLRARAEHVLLHVRAEPGAFEERARDLSNCPTGAQGGMLGWLEQVDCAPEFARELFGHPEVGVLPRLVHSRYGLHVVEVLTRDPGMALPFEEVRPAVAQALRQQSYVTALRQYLMLLAGKADVRGIELQRADTPLVQ